MVGAVAINMSARLRTVIGVLVAAGGCHEPAQTPAVDAAASLDASNAADAEVRPDPPAGLTHWVVGDPADAVVTTKRGLILMGGGTDVDAAFRWQRDRIAGGDVVVLRASGTDGYNDYLMTEIGGVDSVETLLVDTSAVANEPYVRWVIDHAEAIFIAGGDQAVYLAAWKGSPLAAALDAAWNRGAVIGGTSAGCAVLGSIVYSATQGSVYSDEALADPFDAHVTFERAFLALPPLAGVVTDTHFHARDRMGRLLAFVARSAAGAFAAHPLGLGVDESTALVVDETGTATVVGTGRVYAIRPQNAPERCTAGTSLEWANVPLVILRPGDTIALPAGTTPVAPTMLSASGGVLAPADPY